MTSVLTYPCFISCALLGYLRGFRWWCKMRGSKVSVVFRFRAHSGLCNESYIFQIYVVNYFCKKKKLHRKFLTGFLIRLWRVSTFSTETVCISTLDICWTSRTYPGLFHQPDLNRLSYSDKYLTFSLFTFHVKGQFSITIVVNFGLGGGVN